MTALRAWPEGVIFRAQEKDGPDQKRSLTAHHYCGPVASSENPSSCLRGRRDFWLRWCTGPLYVREG